MFGFGENRAIIHRLVTRTEYCVDYGYRGKDDRQRIQRVEWR